MRVSQCGLTYSVGTLAILFIVASGPVLADAISFNLTNTSLTTTSGGTVTFDGTVTNNSGADLNASDFFFNFVSYDPTSVTPNQDLGTPDFPILNGRTSPTAALFDITLGTVSIGSSFPVEVQLEDLNNDLSTIQTVTAFVSGGVTGVPEPRLVWLLAACLTSIGGWRRRRPRQGLESKCRRSMFPNMADQRPHQRFAS